MKFAIALAATVATETVVYGDDVFMEDDVWYGETPKNTRSGGRQISSDGERRYDDLYNIATKYWRKQGMTGSDKFDERKYWAYGCHCWILGDRPMTEMGHGRPVDALDNKCKAYKDCQKCVRETHGEDCIGEFVRYSYRWSSKSSSFESRNPAGTCERELYECDMKFVEDTFANTGVFNQDYHAFWTTTGFDREDEEYCRSNPGNPVDHQCCGGDTGPYYWIGLNKNQCCNGEVKDINDSC